MYLYSYLVGSVHFTSFLCLINFALLFIWIVFCLFFFSCWCSSEMIIRSWIFCYCPAGPRGSVQFLSSLFSLYYSRGVNFIDLFSIWWILSSIIWTLWLILSGDLHFFCNRMLLYLFSCREGSVDPRWKEGSWAVWLWGSVSLGQCRSVLCHTLLCAEAFYIFHLFQEDFLLKHFCDDLLKILVRW